MPCVNTRSAARRASGVKPFENGGTHAVVKGDGDIVWNRVLRDCSSGTPERIYNGGKVEPEDFKQVGSTATR